MRTKRHFSEIIPAADSDVLTKEEAAAYMRRTVSQFDNLIGRKVIPEGIYPDSHPIWIKADLLAALRSLGQRGKDSVEVEEYDDFPEPD